jgi:signal transduction histidine kinase
MEFMDNGIGITDDKKDLIFQKGYKKDNHVRGMGIGLSLVKKIIESYNGKIWVESRVKTDYSQGSNFVLEIPEAI